MRRWMRYSVGTVAFVLFFLSAAGVGAVLAAHHYGSGIDSWRIKGDLVMFTASAAVSYWCLHAVTLRLSP